MPSKIATRPGNVLVGMILAMGLIAISEAASAQKSADTLRLTWRDAVPNVTPYYNPQRTGIVIGHHAWDSLVYRDPEPSKSGLFWRNRSNG